MITIGCIRPTKDGTIYLLLITHYFSIFILKIFQNLKEQTTTPSKQIVPSIYQLTGEAPPNAEPFSDPEFAVFALLFFLILILIEKLIEL